MGDEWIWSNSSDKDLGKMVDENIKCELAACVCSPESQSSPSLPKNHGQQVKGGGSSSQFCSHDTRPGVLHPAQVLRTGRMDALEQVQRMPTKVGQRAGAHLL